MKEMTPSEAWRIFHPELLDVTVDNWTEEDFEDEPTRRQCANDIEKGNITPDVLDEVESCLGRDWCRGKIERAALTVLAANGRLEKFDPQATYWPRRPRTIVLLGERWLR